MKSQNISFINIAFLIRSLSEFDFKINVEFKALQFFMTAVFSLPRSVSLSLHALLCQLATTIEAGSFYSLSNNLSAAS